MPNYNYTALNNNGSKKTGILTASSEREARKYIKELKLTPISVSLSNDRSSFKSRIKNKDIVLMTRQLATLLEANTSIIDALKIIADQLNNSDLIGITRPLSKYCDKNQYPNKGVVKSKRVKYPTCKESITEQSRATHPAWMYKDLEQNHKYYLFLDPQENTCIPFQNNLSTRILEKDNFVAKEPCLLKQRGQPV